MQEASKVIPSTHTYYPQLDGLRGIAILMVMLFHYFPEIPGFRFGWAGVDLFFVLSGFLISSRLIPYINENGILKRFYLNRFFRIIPLYFAFLICFFLIWFSFASTTTLLLNPFYSTYWWSFFLFLQNWIYLLNTQQPIDLLNHFWSLAVEEQFYIIFPFFVLLLRNPKKILSASVILVTIVLLSRVIYFFYFNSTGSYKTIYWNTFFRADSFFYGCILFIVVKYYSSNKKYFIFFRAGAILSFILLLGGALCFKSLHISNPFFGTIGYTLIALLFSYILFKSIEGKYKIWNLIISNAQLKFCGKISYGLYIFHWPAYHAGYTVLNKIFKHSHFITASNVHIINVTCSTIFTFAISYLSFRYFESYFLRMKNSR